MKTLLYVNIYKETLRPYLTNLSVGIYSRGNYVQKWITELQQLDFVRSFVTEPETEENAFSNSDNL
jgi:hypothetical protein